MSIEAIGSEVLLRFRFADFFYIGPDRDKGLDCTEGIHCASGLSLLDSVSFEFWPFSKAAGVIHSDFEKGFIRAEIMSFEDLDRLENEKAVRDAGLLRSEGRDYVMKDGDVVLFRFNTWWW